jgi:spermidine synthase
MGGRSADRNPNYDSLSSIIFKAGLAIGFIPFLSFIVLFPGVATVLGMKYGPLISVLVLFSVPSFYLGMVSPYAVRIAARNLGEIGNTSGNLYAISTLGSIFGTFAAAFFLIPEFGVKSIVYFLSIILIATSFFCYGHKIPKSLIFPAIVLLIVIIVNESYATPIEEGSVVLKKDTAYYEMKIVDYPATKLRVMYLDSSWTGAKYLNSSVAAFKYSDYFHLPRAVNPQIRKVLFIGGGAGIGPQRFLEEYPDVSVDVVDIDPEVNDAAFKYFGLQDSPRLNVYADEGRMFLLKSGKKYDLIVIDAFSSLSSVPYHLTTKEFLEGVRDHLTEEGVVVLNFHSAVTGQKSGLFKAEYKTYAQVYSHVYVFPLSESDKLGNIIFIATKSDKRLSRQDFIEGARNLSTSTGIIGLAGCAERYTTVSEDAYSPVLTDDYAPVESLSLSIFG